MTTTVVPELEAIAKRYKLNLRALDAQVMNDLVRRYGAVYSVARRELDQVVQKRIAARQLGQPEPIGWQYRQERLQKLMQDIGNEVQKFVDNAQTTLSAAQTQAMTEAMAYSQAVAHAALGPVPAGQSFGALWAQLPQQALLNIAANTAEGPLADILSQIAPQAASEARDVIVNGVAQGYNPRKVARELRDQLGAPLARSQTIARTEILRAQREVSQQTFENNPQVVGGWIWQAALDDNTCADCWALDGQHFDVEESMDTHPNCRCTMIPDTTSYQDAGFGEEVAAPYEDMGSLDPNGIAPDLVKVGANVDPLTGEVTVYHRTDIAARDAIERTGQMKGYGGIFFSTVSGEGGAALAYGPGLITLKVPVSELKISEIGHGFEGATVMLPFEGLQTVDVSKYLTSGPAKFAQLSDARMLKILGPAKYRAYKAGAIELRDLIGYREDAIWGRTGYERSLKEVLGKTEAAKYYGPTPSERAAINREREIVRRQNIAARIRERDLQRAAARQAQADAQAAAQEAQRAQEALPAPQPTEVLSQVEADLSNKPVSIIRDMSDGHHNPAYKSHLEGDGDAMVKPRPAPAHAESTHHPSIPPGFDPERERAGWIMAQRMGIDSPAVVIRDVATQDIGDASVQQWREFGTAYNIQPEQRRAAGLFDAVIGNLDRHGGQYGATPEGNLLAYDHGLAFPSWVVDTSGVGEQYIGGMYEWTRNADFIRPFVGSYLTGDEKLLLENLATDSGLRVELQASGLDQKAIDRMYHRINSMLDTGKFMSVEQADQYGMTQEEIYDSIVEAVDNWDAIDFSGDSGDEGW